MDQLKASGVDVSQYTAHSTRGTATSVAAKAGISTQEIMERARWSNESTSEKFYHRPSQDVHKPSAFGAAVLRTQTGMIYKHAYKDMRKEPKLPMYNPRMAKASLRLNAIQDYMRKVEATEPCPYHLIPPLFHYLHDHQAV